MKENTELVSSNAMDFGSEEDYKLAITELRWIIDTFGKAKRRDFENVSSKYNFPIEFLKQGLKELKIPDDYRISKSKWFPILYSWIIQKREVSFKLFRLQIDYQRAKFSLFRNLVILLGIAQMIIISMMNYGLLNFLNLSLLIISFVLFFVALFFEMYNPLSDKKTALDEYCHHLKQRGLGKVVEEQKEFLKSQSKFVRYAGNIMKKKLEEARSITVFAFHMENGTMIFDDYEDPDLEYIRRISELAKTNPA